MSKQEDIDKSTFRYCNDCKKLGRNIDPNMVDDYKAGAKFGYQNAQDKAWEFILSLNKNEYVTRNPRTLEWYFDEDRLKMDFLKTMGDYDSNND